MPSTPRRLMILVRSLDLGGAERQAAQLAIGLRNHGVDVSVAAFYGGGPIAQMLANHRIGVTDLGKRGRWDLAGFAMRLVREVRTRRPDAVLGYLPGPNIALAILRPLLRPSRIGWGIRASNLDAAREDRVSRWSLKLEASLSGMADVIMVNSFAGAAEHAARGYAQPRMRVVPNGVDADLHRYDDGARRALRAELGYADTDFVVGCIARFDPVKGHRVLIDAFADARARFPQARLLLVGDDPHALWSGLHAHAAARGVGDAIRRLPARPDVSAVWSACDAAVSSSLAEGFPNVVAEAMCCQRACVVTDAGDSARIVGDVGIVVPPGDARALAEGLGAVIAMPAEERALRGQRGRARIVEHYGVDRLTLGTLAALDELSR